MKTFLKLVDKITGHSVKFYNKRFYSYNNIYLVYTDETDLNLPAIDIIDYNNLLLFDTLSDVDITVDKDYIVLQKDFMTVKLAYAEINLNELNDYIDKLNDNLVYELNNTLILEKLKDVYDLNSSVEIMLSGNKIICETINSKIEFTLDKEVDREYYNIQEIFDSVNPDILRFYDNRIEAIKEDTHFVVFC